MPLSARPAWYREQAAGGRRVLRGEASGAQPLSSHPSGVPGPEQAGFQMAWKVPVAQGFETAVTRGQLLQ